MNVPLPSGIYPLCAFSIITVPRQGQKYAFRDLNIEENALFLNKKGACFTLKGHFLLRKKDTFWVLETTALASLIIKSLRRIRRVCRGGGGFGVQPPSPFVRKPPPFFFFFFFFLLVTPEIGLVDGRYPYPMALHDCRR